MNEKYNVLEPIAQKIQALDNPIKLKILAMLIEEGAKSITDISKELALNFSTAHKYLEQLQAAGLVSSKEVSENRLKRMFFIEPFDLDISPQGIAKIIEGKKKEQPRRTFKVINERGEEVEFDEKIFSQKYLKRGLPSSTIKLALDSVLAQAYNGITLIELREFFRQALAKKVETISSVMEMIESSEIRGKTYYNLLKLNNPEALKMHMDGDIFIQNLGEPKLLNFMHDLRGIGIHGVNGRRPKTAKDLTDQLVFAIKFVSNFALPYQSVDTFNYYYAPFVKNLNNSEISNELKYTLEKLNDLGSEIFLCLEIGKPEFLLNMPLEFMTEIKDTVTTYSAYAQAAKDISDKILTLIAREKYQNIRAILKVWDKKLLPDCQQGVFVANMYEGWQRPNASFVGFTRFDPNWKKWFGTNRVGEVQEIVLNLPKIAARVSNAEELLSETAKMINFCYELLLGIAEGAGGHFLRSYDVSLKSVQRERWEYVPLVDCPYSISLAGIGPALSKLKINNVEQIKQWTGKIYEYFTDKVHNQKKIRVNLKLNRSRSINTRFAFINKLAVSDMQQPLPLPLQKYFPGGHLEFLEKSKLKDLFSKDFGLVRVV
ncbi:MAG: ArsR family transcriptional regulator [DPANN group archaeon]|nr:ArsR family transcriptional regulator [DPANN group archaeon]